MYQSVSGIIEWICYGYLKDHLEYEERVTYIDV